MEKTIISVESTCDLSAEKIREYGLALVNMEYSVNGETHKMGDGAFTMHEFYEKMRGGAITKTSQVNVFDAKEHLGKLLKEGFDVIHLSFSSSLSGTHENFVSAAKELEKEYPERRIAVIDSLCACAGQGYYAVAVAEYLAAHSFAETVRYAEDLRRRIVHYFVVDDLKYLARGGRISKATALLGNALMMKPVMHMDKEGRLVPYKKVLTRRRSVITLADLVAKNYDKSIKRIYLAHADCPDEANFLADRIEGATGIRPEIFDLGMVIGSHSGPGTLSVYISAKERE